MLALKRNAGGFQLPFTPTQSDVITILSSLIVIQKWALAAWIVPLCWRVAILLMERHGLRRQDLKTLIRHRLLTPHTYLMNVPTFIIGTLLLAGLAGNLASPILTGSISWTQHNITVDSVPKSLKFFEAGTQIDSWNRYRYFNGSKINRNGIAQRAAGLAGMAWRRDAEEGIFKRISRSLESITTGSAIENITLPYFKVESINWVVDRNDIPSRYQGSFDPFIDSFQDGPCEVPVYTIGTAVLSRNYSNPTTWRNDSIVEQSAFLPTHMSARVYRRLRGAIISPMHHIITFPGIAYDACPFGYAGSTKFHDPSLSATWSILMERLAESPVNLSYRTPLPSLVADVNEPRVYSWLGIQLSITFLSIVFIIIFLLGYDKPPGEQIGASSNKRGFSSSRGRRSIEDKGRLVVMGWNLGRGSLKFMHI